MNQEDNPAGRKMKSPSMGYTDVFHNRELWTEMAQEVNGEFKVHLTAGNILESHTLSVPYKKWKIVLSISDAKPLKTTVSFIPLLNFEMVLGREDFTDRILKKLGRQDIVVGWNSFDEIFMIRSNKPDICKAVLTSGIQQLLLKLSVYSLSFQSDIKNHMAELTGVIQRTAANKKTIFGIIELFQLLTDQLEKLKIVT